jgi:hypothetical protein
MVLATGFFDLLKQCFVILRMFVSYRCYKKQLSFIFVSVVDKIEILSKPINL